MTDYPGFKFEVLHKTPPAGACRTDRHAARPLRTPAFIFCATKAAIKAASTADLEAANVDIILANTYHMLIQPGPTWWLRWEGFTSLWAGMDRC